MLDLVAAGVNLTLAVGGALFIGLRLYSVFRLPLVVGYGATLGLLGAAGLASARPGWPRRLTAAGLAIALAVGAALLWPGGPPWAGR